MPTVLGLPISKDAANGEINKFLEIREYTYSNVNAAVSGGGGAITTYYSDMENSFVFDLSQIENLVQELRSQGKTVDGLRVYYSAAPKPETSPVTRSAGSTTLVIVPVEFVISLGGVLESIRNVINNDLSNAALEYPGGCNKPVLYDRVDIVSDDVLASEVIHFQIA